MGEDHLKINKFLVLLPDDLVRKIFYSLDHNTIREEHLLSIEEYLAYINEIGLSFKNKTLKISHLDFFESIKTLYDFADENIYCGPAGVPVLGPDLRIDDPCSWRELLIKLKALLQDVRNKYGTFRREAERHLLEDDKSDTEEVKEESKKYSNVNENITLRGLAISIKGDFMLKGAKEEYLNPVDKALIYFLYYKSLENEDECFTLNDLATEVKMSKGYVKNRITIVNGLIRKIISDKVIVRVGKFIIKGGRGRGYRLNPNFLHIKSKKQKR